VFHHLVQKNCNISCTEPCFNIPLLPPVTHGSPKTLPAFLNECNSGCSVQHPFCSHSNIHHLQLLCLVAPPPFHHWIVFLSYVLLYHSTVGNKIGSHLLHQLPDLDGNEVITPFSYCTGSSGDCLMHPAHSHSSIDLHHPHNYRLLLIHWYPHRIVSQASTAYLGHFAYHKMDAEHPLLCTHPHP
jgi:hypothetical protein